MNTHRSGRRLAALGIVIATVTVAAMTSRADVVSIDVRIVDRNGAPIPDVKPEEMTLRIDGQPRAIVSAEFVGPTAPEKRVFILAVDLASYRSIFDPAAREAAKRLMDQIDDADELGLIAFPGNISVAPSKSRQAVKAALGRMTGAWADLAPADRTMQSLAGIQRAIEFASITPGRKTLVIVSAGVQVSTDSESRGRFEAQVAKMARAAETANITVYSLFMDGAFLQKYGATVQGITLKDEIETLGRSLYSIARECGGTFYRLETFAGPFVERLVKGARTYYRVSFTPVESDRSAVAHKLEVFLNMPGTAYYRQMITIPRQ